jgi:stearoyl-CoA desaturase (delta-9 desaturase)
MASCRQGYRWWEIDITYYVLRILSFVGITHDLRPFRIVAGNTSDGAGS